MSAALICDRNYPVHCGIRYYVKNVGAKVEKRMAREEVRRIPGLSEIHIFVLALVLQEKRRILSKSLLK